MQLSLLSVQDAARPGEPLRSLVTPLPEPPPERSTPDAESQLRERVRRDEDRDARAAATLVPTRSADVISDAERRVDTSSRTFRRQVAREGAAERFRHDRQAFRQALSEAKEKGTTGCGSDRGAAASRSTGTVNVEPREAPDTGTSKKAPASADDTRASSASRAADQPVARSTRPASASARVSSLPGRTATSPVGNSPAAGSAAVITTAIRAFRGTTAGVQSMSSAQVRTARVSGGGTARAGTATGSVAQSEHGAFKAAARALARARVAAAANNADRQANIERIVRVVRSRMSRERSRTIMRLEPPELGRLRLQLDLRGTALALRVETSTPVAHRLLSKEAGRLREGLEAAGLQLERIEIRPPALAAEAGEQGSPQQSATQEQGGGGSAYTDAEHPREQERDFHPADPVEAVSRGNDLELAAESLVNVVA